MKSSSSPMESSGQLMDSLTAHISHYNSSSPSTSQSTNPRSQILKWFSSLTLHQRQSNLTIIDSKFAQILIQMQSKLATQGHGFFIVLPDLPSPHRTELPSLCYRRSGGLLSRISESNELERLIYESVRLFGSREGENVEDCCHDVSLIDSVTFCDEFVENLDRFLSAMDDVSNGKFLRGEESELGSDWVEFEWLKAKGYYSVAAFVANRLEVALRLSWLNSNNVKKKGVKLKEKLNVAGVAANVYWRKKGCLDWWGNLDSGTRRKVFSTILGKSAKSMTDEILKGANNAPEDQIWLFGADARQPGSYNHGLSRQRSSPTLLGTDADFSCTISSSFSGKPTTISNLLNGLLVVQDIFTMILACRDGDYDAGKLFFTSMVSVNTVLDYILRKIRGLLMLVSLEYTKVELLGEQNLKSPPNKSKEKLCAGKHRKKGKTRNVKRPNIVSGSSGDNLTLDAPKDHITGSTQTQNVDITESSSIMIASGHQEKSRSGESTMSTEHAQGSVEGKFQTVARKKKKGKNKSQDQNKNHRLNEKLEVKKSPTATTKASCCSSFSEGETVKSGWKPGNPIPQTVQNDISVISDHIAPKSSGPVMANDHAESDQGGDQFSNLVGPLEPDQSPILPVLDGNVPSDENSTCDVEGLIGDDSKSDFIDRPTQSTDLKHKEGSIQEKLGWKSYHAGPTSSVCASYEWPTVYPVHFPYVNSQHHLPAATDRLHLDVGRNWHNHFHQSYVPTAVHQVRNPRIEGACARIVPRPLPVSLDWPPMVRSISGLGRPVTCNYDSGVIPRRQTSFQQGFGTSAKDDQKYSGDFMDVSDMSNTHELVDEWEGHWLPEEEFDVHAVSGLDYNQYFGGGLMYWNSSDHSGAGFSRPPSLSSDDSSWARHEADMNRAVDDMVAFSSSYSTNGLASPSTAPFCSPFDTLGPTHQAILTGKVVDVMSEENIPGSGDGEGKLGDSLSYPILPPIIIPSMSRNRSRSELKPGKDHKSPCVPPTGREQPRIKRPPSPIVLCVPRAPGPPPPSPVGDSRKHRGFATVRSGSSSPRQWGMRGWFQDGINFEEACVRMDGIEVVWPSWRNKSLSGRPMIQPLPGALLQDRLIAISQLARDQEHPDVAFPLQPPEVLNCPTRKTSLTLIHSLLHGEIDSFWKRVAAENLMRKPYINWAVKRVTRSLQVLWPRSRTNVFGSAATGLALPTSDVDLVVCLPPVRNLEPIKEAGILEGRNGIKETCLQHAARYLANQEWVKNDSLKTVENTAIPIIMLVAEVPDDIIIPTASSIQIPKEDQNKMIGEAGSGDVVCLENSLSPKCLQINNENGEDAKSVRIDISFKSSTHTGLQTTELVKELTEQFPAATPLALVLKQFLADRSLDQSYSGGLSSYCLVLMITRFLQHEHHLGRPINQNFGSLLMDFLYFFGNVFDPRLMRISVQGSGVYMTRERGYSIDPIHVDDPLFPTNNVGRNCFRIHQCIKAFADAYSILENELACVSDNGDSSTRPSHRLLPKIIPSFDLL